MRARLWLTYLAAGGVAMFLHFQLPAGGLEQGLLYEAIGLSAVVAIVVGVRLFQPSYRLPWYAMAVGQLCFVLGDFIWLVYEQLGEAPFPSIADVFYLAGYPFLGAAFLLFIRRRVAGGDRAGLLDAAILTTSAAILAWVFLMQPYTVGSDLSTLELAISVAYPITDVLVIGVAIGLLTTPGARTQAFRLLTVSLVLLLLADVVYALQNLEGTYVAGSVLDGVWLLAYITWGAAALHPSMSSLSEPHPVAVTWLGPIRLVFLAAAMLTGPLLLTLGRSDQAFGAWVVAGGSALLSLLVLARLAGLVRVLARDVAQRRILEEQLSFQAFHDPLTGLANRRLFVERVEAAMRGRSSDGRSSGGRLTGGSIAVLFLDLDDFKTVNDSLGHAAGDELLSVVGARIRGGLRAADTAARLGGDEFGILLQGIPDIPFAAAVAERLLSTLETPLTILGTETFVKASIGIAVDSPTMNTADDLLRDADVAMYQAKALGKGRHQLFAPSMHAEVLDRLQLKDELASAIDNGELRLAYQPLVALDSGDVRGFEALLRWEHPRRGTLAPAAFVPLAEESGLIVAIGRWVADEACRQAARWLELFPGRPLTMSINLSPRQFQQTGLADDLRATLERHRLPPEALVLEITEGTLAEDPESTIASLAAVRSLGVRLAIDDFGTGYSSLSYLRRFPVDILKIDRSFVANLSGEPEDAALARVIVTVGHTLGLQTVAEGIERPEQLAVLRELGCDLGQGFLLARPTDAEAIDLLLSASGTIDLAAALESRVPSRRSADRSVEEPPTGPAAPSAVDVHDRALGGSANAPLLGLEGGPV
jgi:diguanylate cyclase (GGDEF)-like protein